MCTMTSYLIEWLPQDQKRRACNTSTCWRACKKTWIWKLRGHSTLYRCANISRLCYTHSLWTFSWFAQEVACWTCANGGGACQTSKFFLTSNVCHVVIKSARYINRHRHRFMHVAGSGCWLSYHPTVVLLTCCLAGHCLSQIMLCVMFK